MLDSIICILPRYSFLRKVSRICWLVMVLVGSLVPRPAGAQSVTIRPAPLLAQVSILELQNDAAGFTWVAARQGVFRYDGQQLVPLNELVRQGPRPLGMAYTLTIDAAGRVWFGLNDELYVFTPTTGHLMAVPLPPLEADEKSVVLLALHQGALWVGRGHNQIQVSRIGLAARPYRPRVVFEQPSIHIASLAHDSTGALLIILEKRGWRQNAAGTFSPARAWPTEHRHQLSKADGRQVMFPARAELRVPGTRWALTDTTLLETLPTGRRRVAGHWPSRYRSSHYPALQLLEMDSTWYWPGEGEVLALSLRRHPEQPGLQRLPLPLDKEWHLWLRFNRDTTGFFVFAQNAPGVMQLRPQRGVATVLPVAEKLEISTRSINRLDDGRLLVGSYARTFVQAADSPAAPLRRWAPHAFLNQNNDGILFSSLRLPDGRLLAANEFGWFELINGDRVERLTWDQPLQTADRPAAYCVLRTRAGRCWGGGWSGLYQLDVDHRRATRYRAADPAWPLHQCTVQGLAEGAPGELWLATNRGLYWLRPATGELRHYGPSEAGPRHLPTTQINCVLAPHPDSVWLGTLDQGLLLLHPRRGVQQQLTLNHGLPSAAVAFVVQPPGHSLWVGTYDGLVRYDLTTRRSTDYSVANGLASNELNRQSVYYDAAAAQLYVGSVKGVSRLSLREQARPPHRPRLLLLALTQHYAEHDTLQTTYLPNALPGGVYLSAGDAYAEVQVGLTDYAVPDRTRYAYRLLRSGNGRGKWRALGAQPWVRLLGLDPGDYELEIKAETAEGVEAVNRLRVPVQVRTYWWRRPGIWLLLALAMGAATGTGTYWWQRRRAARREARQAAEVALRQRLAADLHDEVGGLLTRVTMRAELLDARQSTPQLAALVQESRSAANTVRDIIWSVDTASDTVEALLDRLRDLIDTTRPASELDIRLLLPPDGPLLAARLRPAVRQHVYLICKESITNALKHGLRSGKLSVDLRFSAEELELVIENDAQDTGDTRSGQGVRSMHTRAATIGGALVVGPQPGGRWRLWLRVPLPLVKPI